MLTNHLIASYNQLLTTSLLYFSVINPLQDMVSTLNNHLNTYVGLDYSLQQQSCGIFALAHSDADRDYYEILGISKDATKHEIHRAFRQKAKKYHPDKNKEPGAQEEFMKIFKAYETLSDEKKRKEYDTRGQGPQQGAFEHWNTGGLHNFDVNEFFKQYEDQFLRHAQHFNQHHDHREYHNGQHQNHHNQQHARFTFAGVDLDDLFHDIDEDEFSSFGNRMFGEAHTHLHNHFGQHSAGSFGDGASFFGSYMPSHMQDSLHHHHHHNMHGGIGSGGGYSCQTVTRNVNGMVMTQTSCS